MKDRFLSKGVLFPYDQYTLAGTDLGNGLTLELEAVADRPSEEQTRFIRHTVNFMLNKFGAFMRPEGADRVLEMQDRVYLLSSDQLNHTLMVAGSVHHRGGALGCYLDGANVVLIDKNPSLDHLSKNGILGHELAHGFQLHNIGAEERIPPLYSEMGAWTYAYLCEHTFPSTGSPNEIPAPEPFLSTYVELIATIGNDAHRYFFGAPLQVWSEDQLKYKFAEVVYSMPGGNNFFI